MKKILLIDDEPVVRQVLVDILKHGGFEVTAFQDGLEAAGTLDNATYDVLITDLMLPYKNGIEIIWDARVNNKNLIIIALTGGASRDINDNAEALEAGADICLLKPVSGFDLLHTLNLFMHDKNMIPA